MLSVPSPRLALSRWLVSCFTDNVKSVWSELADARTPPSPCTPATCSDPHPPRCPQKGQACKQPPHGAPDPSLSASPCPRLPWTSLLRAQGHPFITAPSSSPSSLFLHSLQPGLIPSRTWQRSEQTCACSHRPSLGKLHLRAPRCSRWIHPWLLSFRSISKQHQHYLGNASPVRPSPTITSASSPTHSRPVLSNREIMQATGIFLNFLAVRLKEASDHQCRERILWFWGGEKGERDKLGDWDWYTCATIHKINKNLLYSTGNSVQYSVMIYMGK